MRKHFGLSQRAMAHRVGVSPNTWNGYETRGEAPNSGVLSKLALEGININWLLTGGGEMLSDAPPSTAGPDDLVYIPRYDAIVAAGAGYFPTDHPTALPVAFSRAWLHRELRTGPANLFLIEARGDSMAPVIEDGDILLVDTGEPKFRGDGVYIFSAGNLLLVKQLRMRVNGDVEVLDAAGTVLQSLRRADLDSLFIIGRVVWKAGRT